MEKKNPQKSFAGKDVRGHNGKNKFELVSCPRNGKNCREHLISINRIYTESNIYLQNKEYQESIEALNNAFTETYELNEATCEQCAKTFRFSIIETLQNIHSELHNMSNGFFKAKRYKSSYIFAGSVLGKLKKKGD